MNVILLQRVSKLGTVGEQVRVKAGYARNYLIPQEKALLATPANVAYFNSRRAELEQAQQQRIDLSKQRQGQLDGVQITIAAQAGEEGRLFGSVGAQDIVKALKERGQAVAKSEVKLPLGPLRQIGEYEIELHLEGGSEIAKLKITVVAA